MPDVLVSLAGEPSGRADLARRKSITLQAESHKVGSQPGPRPLLAIAAGQPHVKDFADPLRSACDAPGPDERDLVTMNPLNMNRRCFRRWLPMTTLILKGLLVG